MVKVIYRKIKFFLVPKKLKKNFIQINHEKQKTLKKMITDVYIPTISKAIPNDKISEEVDSHLSKRIFVDRVTVLPWLSRSLNFENLNILEIGCGTGSSSITLAEQGANVLGIDIHKESIEVAKLRAEIYGLNIRFQEYSSVDIDEINESFDAIILYATLEHLTVEERIETLKKCEKILNKGGYLIIIEAPNRLWYFDSHTSELPFFQWLPDNLAYLYSKHSPKVTFSENYLDNDYRDLIGLLRRGRGVSYHEFELAFDNLSKLNVISRLNRLVFTKSYLNTFIVKPIYKMFLKKQTHVQKAFYDEYLDFIIKFN